MKIVLFTILVISATQRQSNAGVVRKPPAFATPVYSNSYLPAAMQVIFHAVDQLKHLDAEEAVSTSPATTVALPTTSPHAPGQHQPSAEEVSIQSTNSAAYETSTASIAYMASTASELSTGFTVSEVSSDSSVSEAVTEASVSESSIDSVASDASSDSAASDVSVASSTDSNAPPASDASTASSTVSETSAASTASAAVADAAASEVSASSTVSEDSTASIAAINPTGSTPTFRDIIEDSQSPAPVPENAGEINEEKPEVIEEVTVVDELKAETPEENYATPEINHEVQEIGQEEAELNQEIPEKNESDEVSSISSLSTNSEVAEASATTALPKPEDKKDSSEEDEGEKSSSEESKEKSGESESKSSSESKSDEDESSEEEDDEIRFTLIGEKVSQVPRPSLSNYLRKTARAPLRSSVQDLATLYDALSKDARKQGLGKYAGYSDEVLQTLESSIEGGVGPQLRILLEKAKERNELTRDDTKKKLSVALKKLADPASILSRDLRRLIPLRYIP